MTRIRRTIIYDRAKDWEDQLMMMWSRGKMDTRDIADVMCTSEAVIYNALHSIREKRRNG